MSGSTGFPSLTQCVMEQFARAESISGASSSASPSDWAALLTTLILIGAGADFLSHVLHRVADQTNGTPSNAVELGSEVISEEFGSFIGLSNLARIPPTLWKHFKLHRSDQNLLENIQSHTRDSEMSSSNLQNEPKNFFSLLFGSDHSQIKTPQIESDENERVISSENPESHSPLLNESHVFSDQSIFAASKKAEAAIQAHNISSKLYPSQYSNDTGADATPTRPPSEHGDDNNFNNNKNTDNSHRGLVSIISAADEVTRKLAIRGASFLSELFSNQSEENNDISDDNALLNSCETDEQQKDSKLNEPHTDRAQNPDKSHSITDASSKPASTDKADTDEQEGNPLILHFDRISSLISKNNNSDESSGIQKGSLLFRLPFITSAFAAGQGRTSPSLANGNRRNSNGATELTDGTLRVSRGEDELDYPVNEDRHSIPKSIENSADLSSKKEGSQEPTKYGSKSFFGFLKRFTDTLSNLMQSNVEPGHNSDVENHKPKSNSNTVDDKNVSNETPDNGRRIPNEHNELPTQPPESETFINNDVPLQASAKRIRRGAIVNREDGFSDVVNDEVSTPHASSTSSSASLMGGAPSDSVIINGVRFPINTSRLTSRQTSSPSRAVSFSQNISSSIANPGVLHTQLAPMTANTPCSAKISSCGGAIADISESESDSSESSVCSGSSHGPCGMGTPGIPLPSNEHPPLPVDNLFMPHPSADSLGEGLSVHDTNMSLAGSLAARSELPRPLNQIAHTNDLIASKSYTSASTPNPPLGLSNPLTPHTPTPSGTTSVADGGDITLSRQFEFALPPLSPITPSSGGLADAEDVSSINKTAADSSKHEVREELTIYHTFDSRGDSIDNNNNNKQQSLDLKLSKSDDNFLNNGDHVKYSKSSTCLPTIILTSGAGVSSEISPLPPCVGLTPGIKTPSSPSTSSITDAIPPIRRRNSDQFKKNEYPPVAVGGSAAKGPFTRRKDFAHQQTDNAMEQQGHKKRRNIPNLRDMVPSNSSSSSSFELLHHQNDDLMRKEKSNSWVDLQDQESNTGSRPAKDVNFNSPARDSHIEFASNGFNSRNNNNNSTLNSTVNNTYLPYGSLSSLNAPSDSNKRVSVSHQPGDVSSGGVGGDIVASPASFMPVNVPKNQSGNLRTGENLPFENLHDPTPLVDKKPLINLFSLDQNGKSDSCPSCSMGETAKRIEKGDLTTIPDVITPGIISICAEDRAENEGFHLREFREHGPPPNDVSPSGGIAAQSSNNPLSSSSHEIHLGSAPIIDEIGHSAAELKKGIHTVDTGKNISSAPDRKQTKPESSLAKSLEAPPAASTLEEAASPITPSHSILGDLKVIENACQVGKTARELNLNMHGSCSGCEKASDPHAQELRHISKVVDAAEHHHARTDSSLSSSSNSSSSSSNKDYPHTKNTHICAIKHSDNKDSSDSLLKKKANTSQLDSDVASKKLCTNKNINPKPKDKNFKKSSLVDIYLHGEKVQVQSFPHEGSPTDWPLPDRSGLTRHPLQHQAEYVENFAATTSDHVHDDEDSEQNIIKKSSPIHDLNDKSAPAKIITDSKLNKSSEHPPISETKTSNKVLLNHHVLPDPSPLLTAQLHTATGEGMGGSPSLFVSPSANPYMSPFKDSHSSNTQNQKQQPSPSLLSDRQTLTPLEVRQLDTASGEGMRKRSPRVVRRQGGRGMAEESTTKDTLLVASRENKMEQESSFMLQSPSDNSIKDQLETASYEGMSPPEIHLPRRFAPSLNQASPLQQTSQAFDPKLKPPTPKEDPNVKSCSSYLSQTSISPSSSPAIQDSGMGGKVVFNSGDSFLNSKLNSRLHFQLPTPTPSGLLNAQLDNASNEGMAVHSPADPTTMNLLPPVQESSHYPTGSLASPLFSSPLNFSLGKSKYQNEKGHWLNKGNDISDREDESYDPVHSRKMVEKVHSKQQNVIEAKGADHEAIEKKNSMEAQNIPLTSSNDNQQSLKENNKNKEIEALNVQLIGGLTMRPESSSAEQEDEKDFCHPSQQGLLDVALDFFLTGRNVPSKKKDKAADDASNPSTSNQISTEAKLNKKSNFQQNDSSTILEDQKFKSQVDPQEHSQHRESSTQVSFPTETANSFADSQKFDAVGTEESNSFTNVHKAGGGGGGDTSNDKYSKSVGKRTIQSSNEDTGSADHGDDATSAPVSLSVSPSSNQDLSKIVASLISPPKNIVHLGGTETPPNTPVIFSGNQPLTNKIASVSSKKKKKQRTPNAKSGPQKAVPFSKSPTGGSDSPPFPHLPSSPNIVSQRAVQPSESPRAPLSTFNDASYIPLHVVGQPGKKESTATNDQHSKAILMAEKSGLRDIASHLKLDYDGFPRAVAKFFEARAEKSFTTEGDIEFTSRDLHELAACALLGGILGYPSPLNSVWSNQKDMLLLSRNFVDLIENDKDDSAAKFIQDYVFNLILHARNVKEFQSGHDKLFFSFLNRTPIKVSSASDVSHQLIAIVIKGIHFLASSLQICFKNLLPIATDSLHDAEVDQSQLMNILEEILSAVTSHPSNIILPCLSSSSHLLESPEIFPHLRGNVEISSGREDGEAVPPSSFREAHSAEHPYAYPHPSSAEIPPEETSNFISSSRLSDHAPTIDSLLAHLDTLSATHEPFMHSSVPSSLPFYSSGKYNITSYNTSDNASAPFAVSASEKDTNAASTSSSADMHREYCLQSGAQRCADKALDALRRMGIGDVADDIDKKIPSLPFMIEIPVLNIDSDTSFDVSNQMLAKKLNEQLKNSQKSLIDPSLSSEKHQEEHSASKPINYSNLTPPPSPIDIHPPAVATASYDSSDPKKSATAAYEFAKVDPLSLTRSSTVQTDDKTAKVPSVIPGFESVTNNFVDIHSLPLKYNPFHPVPPADKLNIASLLPVWSLLPKFRLIHAVILKVFCEETGGNEMDKNFSLESFGCPCSQLAVDSCSYLLAAIILMSRGRIRQTSQRKGDKLKHISMNEVVFVLRV